MQRIQLSASQRPSYTRPYSSVVVRPVSLYSVHSATLYTSKTPGHPGHWHPGRVGSWVSVTDPVPSLVPGIRFTGIPVLEVLHTTLWPPASVLAGGYYDLLLMFLYSGLVFFFFSPPNLGGR